MTKTINTYKFNLNTNTSVLYRFNNVKEKIESFMKNVTSPILMALVGDVYEKFFKACQIMQDYKSDDPEIYYYYGNYYLETIANKRRNLVEFYNIVKTEFNDYNKLHELVYNIIDINYLLGHGCDDNDIEL